MHFKFGTSLVDELFLTFTLYLLKKDVQLKIRVMVCVLYNNYIIPNRMYYTLKQMEFSLFGYERSYLRKRS